MRIQRLLIAATAILALAVPHATTAEPGELPQHDVYVSGQDGYHTYRIPSILVTAKGTVLAFCEGRKGGRSDAGDIDLLVKRSTDGGRTFSPQQTVWDDSSNTCGNPCPVIDRKTGTIWLLLTHNRGEDRESQILDGSSKGTRTAWVSKSTDDGQTWSPPVEITSTTKKPEWTWYATGPGVGVQLKSGRLIVPCDHYEAASKKPYSHVIYSDDGGATWQLGGSVGPGMDESQAVELADGRLLLNMRNGDRGQTQRGVATSTDGGLTWSEIRHDPTLIEPRCQGSIFRYDSGRVLFSNPAQPGKRTTMTVRLSPDECRSWPIGRVIWPGPAAYSCLGVIPDGTILCLYERGDREPYEKITLARITLDWLAE